MGSQRYPQHLGATAVLQTTVAAVSIFANQPLMDHKQGGVPLFKYSSGNTVIHSHYGCNAWFRGLLDSLNSQISSFRTQYERSVIMILVLGVSRLF